MTPPVTHGRKRVRTSPTTEDDESHHSEGNHFHPCPDGRPSRPCQAERKRELERNRRNLVNIRFIELEEELRLSAPRVDSSGRLDGSGDPETTPVLSKGKRIDKEAVLKEAANRIAVQRRDLEAATERLVSVSTEIDNLRAEKVELRSDKIYLRDELETVRKEVQRLREDNINLWQAFQKASAFKESFDADVVELPPELFLSGVNAPTQQSALALSVGNVMAQQNFSVSMSQHLASQDSFQVPQLNRNLQQAQALAQSTQQLGPLEIPGIQNASEKAYTSPNQDNTPALGHSVPTCVAADDMSDLVSHCAPALLQNLGPVTKQNGISPEEVENNNTIRNLLTMHVVSPNDPTKTSSQSLQVNRGELDISYDNQALSKSDSEDADLFSDVAYCV